MITVSEQQLSQMSTSAEDEFAEKLRRHLERCCPDMLPEPGQPRADYVASTIADARAVGLTWQSTIAEFARLTTLRGGGQRVVDPALLAGDRPAVADARFSEEMRRTKIIGSR